VGEWIDVMLGEVFACAVARGGGWQYRLGESMGAPGAIAPSTLAADGEWLCVDESAQDVVTVVLRGGATGQYAEDLSSQLRPRAPPRPPSLGPRR
jgi:hypothetical protein